MDRLEKALQKARAQRNDAAPAPGAAPIQAQAPDAAPDAPGRPAAVRSKAVTVDDGDFERNRIVARAARDPNADIFRILRTKVLQGMERMGAKTIAVTSPTSGDGKTTVAINLALSFALDVKQTVLLVDLDLRDPSVHRFMGLDSPVGLTDYFLDDIPVPDCLVKPEIDRLMVLPIVRPLDNSSEILGTPKMAPLANELKTRYADRIVIYDKPPVLTQDDTIAFMPHVDAVLLVVRDGKTMADHVAECMHVLGDTPILGVVLNDGKEGGVKRATVAAPRGEDA